ncbi:MAG: 3-methyl-2-oxobutanoate hydroxymethyltransferase, partial [Dehalococcoidia bacterium]|nr:3-methyl-2-oxobutanoate hydroxymethyltransferase [Dehalococcoidia bacterium]
MKRSIYDLKGFKERGEKFAMITAYDYPTARLADQAGIPIILVGDSVGMVVLGYESTVPVTLEDMIHHGKAVVRGVEQALVVVDMPFMTYQVSAEEALRNAGRLLKETGAGAVKLEGGISVAPTVARLVEAGIPVMGHLGLTPQSVNQLGGYKLQGKTPRAAVQLLNDAVALQEAGAFAVVLETIPARLGELISTRVTLPTIGIGAGPRCDGQVQVMHDMLGMFEAFKPRHARRYAEVGAVIREAVVRYVEDVKNIEFPGPAESFKVDPATLRDVESMPYRGVTPSQAAAEVPE